LFFSYFGLERRRLPNLESCRALIVTGSLAPGDADVFLDRVIQGGGWLTVLYLALGGTNLEEEAKIASVVRLFSLKTRAVRHSSYRYQPDFSLRWTPLVSLTGTSAAPAPPQERLLSARSRLERLRRTQGSDVASRSAPERVRGRLSHHLDRRREPPVQFFTSRRIAATTAGDRRRGHHADTDRARALPRPGPLAAGG